MTFELVWAYEAFVAVFVVCYRWFQGVSQLHPGWRPDIVNKLYMTRGSGDFTRLRHDLARLHPKTLCYSKSVEMLKHSIGLLVHYLKLAGGAGATEANTCLSLIHPVIQ
ncbi:MULTISPECIES: IS1 family transposase [Moorena]|uniref:Uncharacterized protein n=1 Tax=Moorena producens 3L TaxID=489825 RepID=F4XK82_9CYAN|nr:MULTISPECIES: IS1 family transposase [Moorena]NEQ14808.1 IS1 transposase [Moorena sp. SIO3E2]EGJ35041.1 hypothetical protein LYNGBM3L_09760 [Moorena producens 3L]NEP33729.1 IS1 transposase [Moorena sp. SIO3B2]NEP65743.1 IS1 transposase [Moorena sp. SIO3A5]NER91150.1 IS1 transposase [Moorena sp. SIO3A2]